MDKIGAKILKILLVVGLFAYLLYYNISHDSFSLGAVTASLFLASVVYFLVSLFGILLNLLRNYLIAIIVTVGLAFLLFAKMDEVVAATPLTDESLAIIMCILALVCLAFDIKFIKNQLSAPKEPKAQPMAEDDFDSDQAAASPAPAKTAQQLLKENPEWMMELSKQLEFRRGHKPTYEELIDYIDNEVFRQISEEELDREVQQLVEDTKRKVRAQRERDRADAEE